MQNSKVSLSVILHPGFMGLQRQKFGKLYNGIQNENKPHEAASCAKTF
jgi:hypothetical protein